MPRSVKKGPFIDGHLIEKINDAVQRRARRSSALVAPFDDRARRGRPDVRRAQWSQVRPGVRHREHGRSQVGESLRPAPSTAIPATRRPRSSRTPTGKVTASRRALGPGRLLSAAFFEDARLRSTRTRHALAVAAKNGSSARAPRRRGRADLADRPESERSLALHPFFAAAVAHQRELTPDLPYRARCCATATSVFKPLLQP